MQDAGTTMQDALVGATHCVVLSFCAFCVKKICASATNAFSSFAAQLTDPRKVPVAGSRDDISISHESVADD